MEIDRQRRTSETKSIEPSCAAATPLAIPSRSAIEMGAAIKATRLLRGMSITQCARQAKMPATLLREVERGYGSDIFRLDDMVRLARVLDAEILIGDTRL